MITKSINYWSFPGGLAGTLTAERCIDLAVANGFASVELAIGDSGPIHTGLTDAEVAAIRQYAAEKGVTLDSTASGLYWGRSLAEGTAPERAQALEDLKQMLRISAGLGAKTHLTIPGSVDVFFLPDRPALPSEHVWQFATEGIRAALPVAEQFGVRMGIENVWNRFLLSPRDVAAFVDQFKSPWVGAYVDVANCLPFGYPEDWLRTLGARVVGVHFKDFRRAVGTAEGFVDLLCGDVNWPAVMAALRQIGYSGPVPAEMIPNYKFCPEVQLANTSNAMDAILAL